MKKIVWYIRSFLHINFIFHPSSYIVSVLFHNSGCKFIMFCTSKYQYFFINVRSEKSHAYNLHIHVAMKTVIAINMLFSNFCLI